MKIHSSYFKSPIRWVLITIAVSSLGQAQPGPAELTEAGKKLEAQYQQMMNSLRDSLREKIPKVEGELKTAYDKARQNEKATAAKVSDVSKKLGGVQKYESAVAYRSKVIRNIESQIQATQKQAADATQSEVRSMHEKKVLELQGGLAGQQKGLEAELRELEKVKAASASIVKEMEAAQHEWDLARKGKVQCLEQSGLGSYLNSPGLDADLARYVILQDATPQVLAKFAQQGSEHEALIKRLFGDPELMTRMLIADGPSRPLTGKDQYGSADYGRTMKIYTDIRTTSSKASSGVLERLALAVALEHAVPIGQVNPSGAKDAPTHIDPVKRYLHYEKAFLDGELDPAFETLDTWELRFVVDGEEPDETIAWGREMLRNFHPDHVMNPNFGWRYVRLVSTDVNYGSGNVKFDRPELQNYQNILMNGGICGRRAFIGRFILRAFGVPTIARPSKGHGALAHWTPDGWVVNLGPGWGSGWTGTQYRADLNFLASSQARVDKKAFERVKRAQWIGDVTGEARVYGFKGMDENKIPFWNTVSLNLQQSIIDERKAVALEALGANLGEADEAPTLSGSKDATPKMESITYDQGVITIPAAAFSKPATSTDQVQVMKSHGGGMQIFLPRFGSNGLTILRGGGWRGKPDECKSGWRLLSDGLGRYNNWGLRAAMSAVGDSPPKEVTLDLGNGVNMEMVYIKPGTFAMGGENTKDGRFACVEIPVHEVVITKGYYLGKYEVTQKQFETIMGSNPSRGSKDPNAPVDTIGEGDAVDFCRMVAQKAGKPVRLPTEAEWEFACRAGSKTKWFFGDDPAQLGDYAWFGANDGGKPHPVGQKKPNPWGLYDICGNVWERVSDRYDTNYYANSPKQDPTGPSLEMMSLTEYVIEVPQAGEYFLSAKYVTVNYDQHFMFSVNDGEEVNIDLSFTNGSWQNTDLMRVSLAQGKNTLKFWRIRPPQQGLAIKSYVLTPSK